MSEWYYASEGRANGPVPLGEILMLVQHGTIHRDTLVWNKEMKEWTPANRTELASLFNEQHGIMTENDGDYWGMGEKSFCVAMHLAQFSGCIIPFGNIILPLIMWLMNREKNDSINRHGKSILNWQISLICYLCVGFIFFAIYVMSCSPAPNQWMFINLGIIFIFSVLLGMMMFINPLLGAIMACNQKEWFYPGAISFFRSDK